ncbi:MAG: SH3 domain-containing protein [Treponema sp.]|nr:SH3 domain-containing protein [Treponema sp.]
MKNTLYIIFFLIIFLSNCTKKNNVNQNNETGEVQIEEPAQESSVVDSPNESHEAFLPMFVNSPEGLRIRDTPSLDGNRIGLLEDQERVFVIKKDLTSITIDGMTAQWTFVQTEHIQGWVFGGYLSQNSRHPAADKFISIDAIAVYIFMEHPLKKRIFYNMREVAESFTHYRLISEETLTSIHDKNIVYKDYIFEGDQYIYTNWVFDDSVTKGFSIAPIEFRLDETNYLHLFPHQTREAYLQDNNFGKILRVKTDEIEYYYTKGEDTIALRFHNGFLHSIAMYWFQP